MNDFDNHSKVLKSHGLKKTRIRLDVLNELYVHKHALSHSDLENKMNGYDRVTLYRTLNSFEESGVIHKITDNTGIAKYALCEDCTSDNHQDNHVHFFCLKCHRTYCLDNVDIPNIKVPKNYVVSSRSFTLSGICDCCTHI